MMKVLFVSSGNNEKGLPIINIRNQAKSLVKKEINVIFYVIKGKGVLGYFKNIYPLIKSFNKIDIIHVHYGTSAYLVTIAMVFFSLFHGSIKKKIPIVVSLMGSDIQLSKIHLSFLRYLIMHYWDEVIVKSKYMFDVINLETVKIIPNGVDLEVIRAKEKINEDKYILFASDPSRYSKNFELAKEAYNLLPEDTKSNYKLKVVYGIDHNKLIEELNEAAVMLLTSRYEGASIIVKEAMACNCPIVSTDVGDVKWVIGDTDGCFISGNNAVSVKEKLLEAICFSKSHTKTTGRNRIKKLQLDSSSIAEKIIEIYKRVINGK